MFEYTRIYPKAFWSSIPVYPLAHVLVYRLGQEVCFRKQCLSTSIGTLVPFNSRKQSIDM